jgi:hypothetical protein
VGPVGAAVGIIFIFVWLFGYYLVFEIAAAGRTPGKRAMRLRVVRTDGGPLTVSAALVRTILRIVDFLPWGYAVGAIAAFTSERNQRLGDMAAGTVVVQEARSVDAMPPLPAAAVRPSTPAAATASTGWDVTYVTQQEIVLIKRFMARRWELDTAVRNRFAHQLVDRLNPKVVRPPGDMPLETFLERVVAAKEGRNG